jgi:homoserine/homoserine lactone efflux protein
MMNKTSLPDKFALIQEHWRPKVVAQLNGQELKMVKDMSLHNFLLYVLTWSLVALTPGPAVMCAMAQATRFGFRSSIVSIMGIQFGNFLFFVGIALGLATLLATATTAFNVLRIVGAAYLFYLGVRIVASSFRRSSAGPAKDSAPPPARRSLFLQGLLIQLSNPKALLFVSALLPQFIEPGRPVLLQLALLVAATILVDLVVLSAYAFFAGRGAQAFRTSRLAPWIERAFGTALVFFGVRLLLSRNR